MPRLRMNGMYCLEASAVYNTHNERIPLLQLYPTTPPMASPRRPATLPELSTEPFQVRTTSPSHTSTSSSPDASEPESQNATPLGFDPSVVVAMNHYDEHAKSAPELAASPTKEAGRNIGTPDIAIIGSPVGDLPNPYEAPPGLRKSLSTADLYGSQARTSVDSDNVAIQRLPSILRPAHPRFADSTDSRRASMAIPGVGFGLPLPTEEEFQRILDSHGTASMAESMTSLDPEDRRPFPTYDNSPYGTAGRLSFAFETRSPFVSAEGLTVPPMLDGDRIRRHSAAATSHQVQPALRHGHSSSPLSHPTGESEREEPTQVRKDQQFTDLWPEVPTGKVKKRASRWKFWTK